VPSLPARCLRIAARWILTVVGLTVNLNVADPLRRAAQALAPRGKNALECAPVEGGAAHRFGQDEAYFTVREILAEASTAVPPKAGL